jgi:hypothetical protein
VLIHERHDHLDEISERSHGVDDLVVVVGLAAWVPADAPDTQERAEELAHLSIGRSEPDREGKGGTGAVGAAVHGRSGERAFGGHEACEEVTDGRANPGCHQPVAW